MNSNRHQNYAEIDTNVTQTNNLDNSPVSCIWRPPISNEKILEYNKTRLSAFNFPRTFMNPPLSDKIDTNFSQPILLVEPEIEEKIANNWNNEINNKGERIDYESLDYYTRRYKNRPWLLGISYDINTDSMLKNLNYYNHRDCIPETDVKILNRMELDASISIMKKANQNFNIYPSITRQWFDNNTRVKTL